MPEEPAMPTPTKNETYNLLLVKWAEAGHPINPECEFCGRDLTGQHVHDTGLSWVCDACLIASNDPGSADYREDFHADC
jgi:hypothetical protein